MPAAGQNSSEGNAVASRTPLAPELLAPAGDWECAKAAVENGADAIYFGLERFNARMRARNFTEADLPELMEFLRRRGVRGYVTFNTLVFANELTEAEQHLRSIIAAGVDAAIVQDVGIAGLIRRLSPDFPIHASTQMTITSAAGVEFASELGCELVVLARECSLKEIAAIQNSFERTSNADPGGVSKPGKRNPKLEVFVHGALCVAYSGQCLTSEALGGRSANRGECAQACRMPYELICDDTPVPLGDRKYLLSPQDLAGLEVLPELVASGVASLKIEGRLKSPEYVANITRVYRQALDRITQGASQGADLRSRDDESKYELEMAFSRGLYTGWFRGTDNQRLVHARFGKKRGVYLGQVQHVRGEKVFIRLEAPLKPGDGVVFDHGHPEAEEGGRVFELQSRHDAIGPVATVTFQRGAVAFSRVHAGDKVWKTSDPELDRRLRQTFAGDKPHFQRPVSFECHGHAGAPLTIIARDEFGNVAQGTSSTPLVEARTQPLTTERLREQFGRLGATPFRLGDLKNFCEGSLMLPLSELNRLRRELVSRLEGQRVQPKRWTLHEPEGWATLSPARWSETLSVPGCVSDSRRGGDTTALSARTVHGPDARSSLKVEALLERETGGGQCNAFSNHLAKAALGAPSLIVLVRSFPQLHAALRCGIQTIYCEFEDPKRYREAVSVFRAAQSALRDRHSGIFVAPPRISKTGEEWILQQVRSSEADGYLARNYDHLNSFAGQRLIGDFSLNVANALTAQYFISRYGLERLTASYDLNFVQLEALLRSAPPHWFEMTIHQHIPMFHMEHCVFCAFLSDGTDYRNCGRPCDKHAVRLKDRVGMEHPLKADAGCRNTLFNARAQTGAEYVARMIALGAQRFRLEFLNESPEQVAQTIAMYRRLLTGEITGAELWRELKLKSQLGVTRGAMERPEAAE